MATAAETSGALPPGLLVRGSRAALAGSFACLVDLQPVAWLGEGLVCAPRAAPEQAGPALARLALPADVLTAPPAHPDPPARLAGGWYVRSPAHAPAPPGWREIIEAPGEGFGPLAHPTSAACLSLMETLPAGSALDAGCGSGLLAQAWAALGRGSVLALDIDPRAIMHACMGLEVAGLTDDVRVERRSLSSLPANALAGRVLLANLPPPGHQALLSAVTVAPRAALVSGVRAGDAPAVLAGYRHLGLRVAAVRRAGAWTAWTLHPSHRR